METEKQNNWMKIEPGQAPPRTESQKIDAAFGIHMKICQFFSDDWSVAGLKYVVRQGTLWIRRIIWLIFVLFGFGFMVYQINDRIIHFLSNPTSTEIKINYKDKLPFPVVTICNENEVDASKASQIKGFTEMITTLFPMLPSSNSPPWENISATIRKIEVTNQSWEDVYRSVSPVTEPTPVIDCSHGVEKCNYDSKFDFVTSDMGWCLQYNVAFNLSVDSGLSSSLSLLLRVDQTKYLKQRKTGAGYTVLLHSQHDPPLAAELGFKLPAGQETTVAMNLKSVHTLPKPFGSCSDLLTQDYNVLRCMNDCYHEYIKVTCNCRHYTYKAYSDMNACSPEEMFKCANLAHIQYFLENVTNCNCPPQCDVDYYETSISSMPFSTLAKRMYAEKLFCEANQLNCDAASVAQVMSLIEQDYAKLDIYFLDSKHEEMYMIPSYTILALLCDIGGALGLILGSTVLTLFEIMDFGVVMLYEFIVWRKRRHAVKNSN